MANDVHSAAFVVIHKDDPTNFLVVCSTGSVIDPGGVKRAVICPEDRLNAKLTWLEQGHFIYEQTP